MDATLLGVDHPDLDAIEVRRVFPDVAIALSRGRYMKQYRYVDPNEDAVAVHRDRDRTVLLVADGHNGHQGSHVAVADVLAQMAPGIPLWSRHDAVRAFHRVNEHIREVRGALPEPHGRTRTTLAVAVVTADETGQPYVIHASVGDSVILVVRDGYVHRLTRDRQYFLGDRMTAPLVAGAMDYDRTDLAAGDMVLAATDGLTNFVPVHAVAEVHDPDPAVMAAGVVDLAGRGGAGDNVAVAVMAISDAHMAVTDAGRPHPSGAG